MSVCAPNVKLSMTALAAPKSRQRFVRLHQLTDKFQSPRFVAHKRNHSGNSRDSDNVSNSNNIDRGRQGKEPETTVKMKMKTTKQNEWQSRFSRRQSRE